jgi:hypothetical protein
VLGFSAGGHLTANLCNNVDKRAYEPVDDADGVTSRPDFALPMYPAYLALKKEKGRHCSLAHIGRSRRLFSNIWQPICRVANTAPDALPSRRTVLSAFQNLPSRRLAFRLRRTVFAVWRGDAVWCSMAAIGSALHYENRRQPVRPAPRRAKKRLPLSF